MKASQVRKEFSSVLNRALTGERVVFYRNGLEFTIECSGVDIISKGHVVTDNVVQERTKAYKDVQERTTLCKKHGVDKSICELMKH